MLKKYLHNPPHLLLDQQMYFITGSTLHHAPLLKDSAVKKELLNIIEDFLTRKGWSLDHWVVLDTHYHFTAQSAKGDDLSMIIGNIHRKSAKIIRTFGNQVSQEKVWHNYWDRCVRDEEEYHNCLNYIFWNPVNHRYVDDPLSYEWSSFYWQNKEGVDVKRWGFLGKPLLTLEFLPKEMVEMTSVPSTKSRTARHQ